MVSLLKTHTESLKESLSYYNKSLKIDVLNPCLELNLNEIEILGIEAPVWTETVSSFDELSYLVFPRLLGHSEVGWTSKDLRKWEDYNQRLKKHKIHLKSINIESPY